MTNALKDNFLLAEIRGHSAKSISLYKQLIKAGVNKNEAKSMMMSELRDYVFKDQMSEDCPQKDV
jgi:hypothetical protein